MELIRNRQEKILKLTQTAYIDDIYHKFLGNIAKEVSVPVLSTEADAFMRMAGPKDDAERAGMRRRPYLALMGSLIWATMTHPEVAYHTSLLCRFMHDPSEATWEAALKILAYLYHVRKLGLRYEGKLASLITYCDSSWNSPDGPTPFGGHVIFLCGAAVSFSSRKLKIIPQSSAEAESAVYAMAAKDLRFCQLLLTFIETPIKLPTPIYLPPVLPTKYLCDS